MTLPARHRPRTIWEFTIAIVRRLSFRAKTVVIVVKSPVKDESKNQKTSKYWSVSEIFGGIIVVLLLGNFIYVGLFQWLENKLLDKGAKVTKAVIIDDRNYMGNSPVSQSFTYSYLFQVNGKSYKNDSRDSRLNIGDTIDVEYFPTFPKFNRLAPK